MDEHFDSIKAHMAQVKYCKDNHLPHFAPNRFCYRCNRDIYLKISVEKAGSRLITGCPYCHRTYCD